SLRRRLGAQGPGRLRPVAASFDAGNGLEVTRLRQTMVEQVLLRPAVDLGVFGLDRLLIERRRGRDAFGPQTLGQPFGGASRSICRPPFLRGVEFGVAGRLGRLRLPPWSWPDRRLW